MADEQQQQPTASGPEKVIGVDWMIVGGSPSVTMQIVLNAPGVTLSTVPGIGSLVTVTFNPATAHNLASVLADKAEAAARKAGVVLENKLRSEPS